MPGEHFPRRPKMVLDELPDLPHLPELPARGAIADKTGRATALWSPSSASTSSRPDGG